MPPELQIQISKKRDTVIVKLIGEAHFDLLVADQYLDSILKHKPKTVIVDASELAFLSSVGMCLLINLKRAVTRQNGSTTGKADGAAIVKIAGLQPLVKESLQHAMLLPHFETYADVASALENRAI